MCQKEILQISDSASFSYTAEAEWDESSEFLLTPALLQNSNQKQTAWLPLSSQL